MVKMAAAPITTSHEFVNLTITEAKMQGYPIEKSRNGRQINFGHKKLHEKHLQALFPSILQPNADIAALIQIVARGRPCTHKPMREIICNLTGKIDAPR
jgi:hypothetical protein